MHIDKCSKPQFKFGVLLCFGMTRPTGTILIINQHLKLTTSGKDHFIIGGGGGGGVGGVFFINKKGGRKKNKRKKKLPNPSLLLLGSWNEC